MRRNQSDPATITQIRQGDVLLIRRDAPADATRDENARGARIPGERSGHEHVIEAPVYILPSGDRWLRVDAPTPLRTVRSDTGAPWQDRHADVIVPAGWWEVVPQRQYAPRSRPVRRSRYD